MAEEYDKETAAARQDRYISEARRIRDGLNNNVVDYYNYYPGSKDEEREQKAGMRKYLDIARDRITDLIYRLR